MRKIKINYVGWWDGFNPDTYLINQILKKYYEVEISDNPDYVFCSPYTNEFLKYDCIRIFYTAENVTPDFNIFDYCIGFDEMEFGDRYIRVPNYIMNPKYMNDLELMSKRHLTDENNDKRKFCSFVCSNGNGDLMRDAIFEEVSKYKHVASGGRHLNNIGLPDGVKSKLEFQQNYKFALALENTSFTGYTTEKLIEAYAAGGIPIYWGDPAVKKYFREGSFINVLDFRTLDDAIEEIKRVDQDEKLYVSYLRTSALVNPEHVEQIKSDFEKFLIHIIEQPLETASRRNHGIWGRHVTGIVERGTSKNVTPKETILEDVWRKVKKYIHR